ncbi:hypothetical protein J3F84DRAFT_407452 [Trichoderma pleuroticola]
MAPFGQQGSIITVIGGKDATPEKTYELLKKLKTPYKIYQKIHAAFDRYKEQCEEEAKNSSNPTSFKDKQIKNAVTDLEDILRCEKDESSSKDNDVEIVTVRLFMEAISDRDRSESEDENNETMEFETFSIVTRVMCSIRPTMPFDSTNEAKYQNNVNVSTINFPDDTPFEAASAYTICLHLSTVNIEHQSFSEYVQWLQAQTAEAGNFFRFESILKYANFPDLHAQPPKNTEDVIGSLQIDHKEISVVFKWLRERGVEQVLELSVPDRLLCPHSDDQVAYCVNGFRIRVLNWRKLDLYLGNLSDKKYLKELHLYSSGNTAVYKGWLEALPEFVNLKKLRVYVVKDVLSTNRVQKIRNELQKEFNKLNAKLDFRWVKTKSSAKGSSELPNVSVKEYSWVKGQTNQEYRNLADIDVVGPNLAAFINKYQLTIRSKKDSHRTKVALIDSGIVVVGGKRAMRFGAYDMENELKLGENIERPGQELIPNGDNNSQPIDSQSEETEKWWNQDLSRQVVEGESFVNTGDDEEQVWWHASEPHGTQMARLICSVDPCCELYVAKVAETRSSGVPADVLAEAMRWAISKNVDVISLSLVAYTHTDKLNKAIIEASNQDIIVLCSTADEGFLPRDAVKQGGHQNEVITITACDKWGNLLDRSQPGGYNYRFMGNNVQIGQVPFLKSHEFITGSSVSTAIAAGTASLIIACSRLSGTCNTHEEPNKTKWRSKMVKNKFNIMKHESGKDYVVLENLCGTRKNLQDTDFAAIVDGSFDFKKLEAANLLFALSDSSQRSSFSESYPQIINTNTSEKRVIQRKKLIEYWLDDENENAGEYDDDDTHQLNRRLKAWIYDMCTKTPEAVDIWVAISYIVSKMLLPPTRLNGDNCQSLVYIISRMEWYIRLPNILAEDAQHVERHRDLQSRIVTLFRSIMSYFMTMVCSHFNNHIFDALMGTAPQTSLEIFNDVINAENAIPLLNENNVGTLLENFLKVAMEKSNPSVQENDRLHLSEENAQRLNELDVVDPRISILSPGTDPNSSMQMLKGALLLTQQWKTFQAGHTKEDRLLWISGSAGCGKTMLLTSIIQTMLLDRRNWNGKP